RGSNCDGVSLPWKILSATPTAFAPETRTSAMAPSPGGVETAAMVSETVIPWQIVGQPPRLPNCANNSLCSCAKRQSAAAPHDVTVIVGIHDALVSWSAAVFRRFSTVTFPACLMVAHHFLQRRD